MSLARALGGPIVIAVAGSQREFKPLRLKEWAQYQAFLQDQQRKDRGFWLKAAVEAGLKPGFLPAAIRDLDRAPTSGECWAHAFTPEGARQVLLLSMRRDRHDAKIEDVDDLDINPADLQTLALQIAGFDGSGGDGGDGSGDDAAGGAAPGGDQAGPLDGTSTSPTG